MRIAQILYNKAHWIFESKDIFGIDGIPDLPPDSDGNPIVLIDVSNNLQVKEGWDYNSITGKFTEPVIVPVEPHPEPPQPNNQDIAKMISDLEFQLIMNGVI